MQILNKLLTATGLTLITVTGAYLCYNLVIIAGYGFLTLLNNFGGIS